MNIAIETIGTKISVSSPYNSAFVKSARRLGGKFSSDKAWVFDAREEAAVKSALLRCYGTDGTQCDLVDIEVDFFENDWVRCGPIELLGRIIARAWDRDGGAKTGDGIIVLSGGFSSGGSRNNWTTTVRSNTRVIVRDFPRARLDDLDRDYKIVVAEDDKKNALTEERDRLMKRLDEINTLLAA